MSLTSVLKDPSIKARFKKRFPVPKMPRTEILAEPTVKKDSIIGTTFDCIIRFHIKKSFLDAIDRRWVAEEAVDQIKLRSDEYVMVDGIMRPFDRTMSTHEQYLDATECHYMEYSKEWTDLIIMSENTLHHAKRHYDDFIRTGTMTRNLLEASLNLATLDLAMRTGEMFWMPLVTCHL